MVGCDLGGYHPLISDKSRLVTRRERSMDSNTGPTVAAPEQRSTSSSASPATCAQPSGVAVLDEIEVVVFALTRDASVEFISQTWHRMSGFSPDDVHRTNLLDYVHPGDHGIVTKCLEDSRHQTTLLVARWLTRAGECRRLEMRVRMRVGSNGERTGFVGMLADVTRQEQAADVRKASHRTVETLINNLPGMVYRCRNNRHWTMEYVSQGARELTGWQPEDFVNNTRVAFASLILEEDRQQVWDQVQICLRENRPFELVYRIRTADGIEKWVLERGQGNYSTSGELLSLEGFITDITAEKRDELRGQHDALYDTTGLPKPALVLDRIGQALARVRGDRMSETSVVRIYLDRFARFRRQLDPEMSERIVTAVGRRLKAALAPTDSICRWSDVEFIVLIDDASETVAAVARLQDSLREAIREGDVEIYLTASIGVVIRCGGYQQIDDILTDATAAMSRARDLGGDRAELACIHVEEQRASM